MAKSEVRRYVANVEIKFEGLKPPVKVKKGDLIPVNVPDATIKDLLMDGAIEEVKESK